MSGQATENPFLFKFRAMERISWAVPVSPWISRQRFLSPGKKKLLSGISALSRQSSRVEKIIIAFLLSLLKFYYCFLGDIYAGIKKPGIIACRHHRYTLKFYPLG